MTEPSTQKSLRRNGQITRSKMMRAAVTLFLESGYQKTTIAQISNLAEMTTSAFFRAFPDKETILFSLTSYVFDYQFEQVELLLGEEGDPLLLYGVEIALQLYITEQSEALRDVYVMAHSLSTTSELIYKKMTNWLMHIFAKTMPAATGVDFYELEIASGSILRGYMAKPCDLYFTMERKLRRCLSITFKLYDVPLEIRESIISQVLAMDLYQFAENLIKEVVQNAEEGIFMCEAHNRFSLASPAGTPVGLSPFSCTATLSQSVATID